MTHAIRTGTTDQIAYFRAYDTDGTAKVNLTSATAGLSLSVFRVGASAVSISSLSDKAADNTAHADGAIRRVQGNLYTIDLPDAAIATQVPSIRVKGTYTGGEIEGEPHPIVGYDGTAVRVGAAAAGDAMALVANQDVRNVGGSLPAVVLAASQPHYAPARAGDEMSLTSTVLGQLFSDTDTTALVNAIIARVESDLDGADLSTAAIAVAVRNEILNRVLSGNHETAGTVGKVLQFLDATISGRMASGNVTVGGYAAGQDPAALLAGTVTKVATVDALLAALTEVVSSVTRFKAAALSQAPSGGGGGSGDAEQATLLEVQETVTAISAALAGAPVEPTGRIASGGQIVAYIGDDFRVRSGTQLQIPVSDPSGGLYTKLNAIGAANLYFGASRSGKDAGAITGTVASLAQSGSGASQLLLITVEIANCGNGLQPADDYEYQIEQRQTQGSETDSFVEISGTLELKRKVV